MAVKLNNWKRDSSMAIGSTASQAEDHGRNIAELERNIEERTLKLAAAEQTIAEQRMKLSELRNELLDVNNAMLTMSRSVERMRAEMELEVAAAIRRRIAPILKQLESSEHCRKYMADLQMLYLHLDHLSAGPSGNGAWSSSLSPMELRVAALVRNGFTSREIADRLHLSQHTVNTHRRNIRKKLNLHHTPANMMTYLNG